MASKVENAKSKRENIIKIIILTVIIMWIICFFIDYLRARQMKDPIFCIFENTEKYDDGTVYSCTGLGYKMYRYNRSSIGANLEFGPFFMKERTK